MEQGSWLEVITPDDWRKKYSLTEHITYLGSRSTNHVELGEAQGGDVLPLHAQLIASNGQEGGYRLVNLADSEIRFEGAPSLAPRTAKLLENEAQFFIGEFKLVFHSQNPTSTATPVGQQGSSRKIGVRVGLARQQLIPNQSLDGVITIQNIGDRSGVQFELDLEGLDDDCYDIEPGPLLSAGAEKEVFFRLHHLGSKPLAGTHEIIIQVSAPRDYPADPALISQSIEVLPHYNHQLRLIGDNDRSDQSKTPPEPVKKVEPSPPKIEQPERLQPTRSSNDEDWWAAPAEPEPTEAIETVSPPMVEPESAKAPTPQVEKPEPAQKSWWQRWFVRSQTPETAVSAQSKQSAEPEAPPPPETLPIANPIEPVKIERIEPEIKTEAQPVEEESVKIEPLVQQSTSIKTPVQSTSPEPSLLPQEQSSVSQSEILIEPPTSPSLEIEEKIEIETTPTAFPTENTSEITNTPAPSSTADETDESEDWWSAPVEPSQPAPQIPPVKSVTPSTPKPIATQEDDDWWDEDETNDTTISQTRPIIKMKATANTSSATEQKVSKETRATTDTDDWWSESDGM